MKLLHLIITISDEQHIVFQYLAQTKRTRPPHVTRDPLAPRATPLWKTTMPGVA